MEPTSMQAVPQWPDFGLFGSVDKKMMTPSLLVAEEQSLKNSRWRTVAEEQALSLRKSLPNRSAANLYYT